MRLTRAARPAFLAALTFVLASLAGPVAPARAQQAQPAQQDASTNHLAAARELLSVAGTSGSIDRIIPSLLEEVRRQAVTRPEIAKDIDEVLKVLGPELDQQRQQAYLIASRAYARLLTEAEIKDAIAFFRSPSGAKYIRIQPQLTDALVNSITAWTQLAAEYIQTRVRAEMVKRGHQL